MDTRDFFPKSTPSHWYCLPLLSSIPEESRASFLAGFANMLNGLFLDTFVRRNTHQKGTLIKKELIGIPILSKGNLENHQTFGVGFYSGEASSYHVTLILKKKGTLILKKKGTLMLSKRNY